MTFVLINHAPDGRHVRAFKTADAALKALAKFLGRNVDHNGDPLAVGKTVYSDWGNRLVIEERPTGHTAAHEMAFVKAYDAREMGIATKAQLKLLGDADEANERELEIAQFGDGRPTFHHGQDGDPSNGTRIFNSKEDDAAAEAEAEKLRQAAQRLRDDP